MFKHVPGEENRKITGLKELYALTDPKIYEEMAKDVAALRKKKTAEEKQKAIAEFKAKHAAWSKEDKLALQAKQSIQAQQLQITQDRAASLELARQAAAVERGREVARRFIGGGTAYTPQGVSYYGN